MKRELQKKTYYLFYLMVLLMSIPALAQNIFSGEPVQVVGSFNGYATTPYNADYRTCYYRRVSTPSGNPTDGRGQWVTNINVQNSGGNVTPINMTGGPGNGFLFISGPSANRFQNKWVFSGIGSGAVDAINNISAFNSGNDMGLNMLTPGQYNFTFNDAGYTQANAKYYVGYTSSIVVQAFRTSQSLVNGQAEINITTAGIPSSEQKIYVRYRVGTNDFTSSTNVVQATGSGTNWTAIIPAQCNSTVYYYVYSSTRSLAQITADSEMDKSLATLLWDDNAGNNYSVVFGPAIAYYQDLDGDGFGNPLISLSSCAGAPLGYVSNSSDCNDNQLQYLDADGDTFGHPTTLVGCGVANNADCNDNQLQYQDNDGDGFGNPFVLVGCGVTNAADCNDNQLQYLDADGDSFGNPLVLVGCGVTNNSDCNDNQLQYQDNDGDSFGNPFVLVGCGVTNVADCNDNQLQYLDADGDSFGNPAVLVGCGVTNNSDCNDNQLQYQDNDGDSFGNPFVLVGCGVTNAADCNDTQLQYLDADGDSFGNPAVLVGCGVTNNSDCNDNQLQYQDNDNDGFGNPLILVGCGVANAADCNDTQLQYLDADGDSFGNPAVLVGCGVTNNFDCNDNQLQYQDNDNDGFGNPLILVGCGVANAADCNDNVVFYVDNDGDGLGSTVFAACPGVTNNLDCNDNDFFNLTGITFYQDFDGDGFGNPAITISACIAPVGYVINNLDCNDANAAIKPGAVDVCYDGLDNDCDGTIDDGCTPIVSTVQGTQCNTTLPLISTSIFANLVAGAQGYRFKVTDMSTMQVQTIDKVLRVFALTQLGNYAFDRTYQVEVAIRYNNVWQPFFGAPCTITTPETTTQVQSVQCPGTLTTMGDVILANNVPYSTGYRFRVINLLTSAVSIIDRPTRDIRLNNNPGFTPEFNTTYSLELSVRNTDGSYLMYGTPCSITTPSFPTSQLQLTQCDVTISNSNTTIYADSYPGASQYRFRFVNTTLGFSYSFDRPIRSFILSSVPGLLPSTTYSVQVSIEINGVFGPYGKVCTLTTPAAAKFESSVSQTETNFLVTAYPNPFAENFKLEVTTSTEAIIEVKAYDMLGRLVDDRKVDASTVSDFEIGSNYPSGVYNIVVSQGDNLQTLRVIKR